MKIILLDDVTKVGRRGEVRDVSDGYARNFLIPKKLALSATAGNLKNLEHIKRQQDAKADRVKADAETLRAKIEALVYEERRQASEEGKLFGSVTSQDVADFLGTRGVPMDRKRITLDEPIKALGEHLVSMRLHQDVTAQLRVNVVREEPFGLIGPRGFFSGTDPLSTSPSTKFREISTGCPPCIHQTPRRSEFV